MISKLLYKSGFFKNIFTLSFGVAVSQLIVFLFQLVLRRIYTADIFGTFDVYFSIYGILVVLVLLRYELAIILPKTDRSASNIVVLAIMFSFVINAIILLCIIIYKDKVVDFINFPEKYSYWLYFLPMTVFFFSSYQTINYWLIRKKAFRVSSFNKVIRRSFEGTTQFGIGYFLSNIGLVLGDLVGNFINVLVGSFQLFRNNFTLNYISKKNLLFVFKRYSDFPKYNLIPSLLNTLSKALPILIINKFFNETITGYFGLTKTILAIPFAIIAVAVSQVLLQRISEKKNNKLSIKTDFFQITVILSLISLCVIFIFSFFGTEIITFLFSKTWTKSGEFIKILVYSFAITFVVSPLSIIFFALEKIKIQAIWQIGYFVLILFLFLLKEVSIEIFLIVYVLIDILAYTGYYVLMVRLVNKYELTLRIK